MTQKELKKLADAIVTKRLPWKDTDWGTFKVKTAHYVAYLNYHERLEIYFRSPWYRENQFIARLQLAEGTWEAVRNGLYNSKAHIDLFLEEVARG